jgi:cation-transporting ATPase 13A3/4/5
VGTILPPLLPTVFTVSVSISDNRLSENGIACTNNEAILVAGKVQVALFDKTGTLTNQGLDFISARSMIHWDSDECDGLSGEMALGMATCHGLARSKDGALIGNPVDQVMFAASGGAFENVVGASAKVTDVNGNSVEVVKNYDFCNDRMTQSVIVKKQDKLLAFVKGSGENVKKLCTSESLPGDFDASLQSSAKQGVYQISMASKVLPADTELSKISRDDVEKELTFAGVVNFKNVLREDTPAVLRELEEGSVRTVMVTGDSLLTGIRIAKESGMIKPDKKVFIGRSDGSGIVWVDESDDRIVSISDIKANAEIAITGEAWEILRQSNPKEAASLTQLTRVFGRCTPNHKVAVVTSFIELGKVTMMCGDGSNDCGALKTAHVGIALSDSEASIVAPFTSLDKSITSVSELLREGRCALASALASYKYMIMYGQIETINQLMNAYFRITFADWCWVFMDGIWTITLAFSLALSRPENKLAPTRPTSSLLGPHTLSSALGVLGIQFIFTVIALATLFHQDWFQCRKWNGEDVSNVLVIGDNYESEVIFLVTGYQYISSALAFSFGYEWRMAFYLNYVFVILFLVYTFFQWWITVRADSFSCIWRVNCVNDNAVRSVTGEPIPIQNPFNTTEMPTSFRWTLIGIMAANTIAVVIWEFYIVNGIRKRMAAKRLAEKEVGQGIEETMRKVESSMALDVESQHTP